MARRRATLELDEPKPKLQWVMVMVYQYFRRRQRDQTWQKTVEAGMALLKTLATRSLPFGRHCLLFRISMQFEGRLQKVQSQKRGMGTRHGG